MLNSENMQLNLVQLIKLYLHELGHKTGLGTVSARDQWAQQIEDKLESFYFSSGLANDPEEMRIEALSFPAQMIQSPISPSVYDMQPTTWMYAQVGGQVIDMSATLGEAVSKNSMLARTIGTEVIAAISALANSFMGILKNNLGPFFDAIANGFAEPGAPKAPGVFGDIPVGMQAMSVMNIRRITQSAKEITIEASQNYIRSHAKKMNFDLGALPFSVSGENFPISIKMVKPSTAEQFQKNPRITLQLSAEPNFRKVAKVGRIIRQDGVLKSLELRFENQVFPFSVDLALQYEGGNFRLRAKDRELLSGATYQASFDFSSPQAQRTSYVDRIVVDNEEVIFLDRKIDVQEIDFSPGIFADGDIVSESIGLWGKRESEDELGKNFSHMMPSFLFFVPMMSKEVFVINPYNLWIEFEVRKDIDIAQVELIWTVQKMIIDTRPDEKPDSKNKQAQVISITEQTEQGDIPQRYTTGGKLIDRQTMRENILFERDQLKELPSPRPGYKTVRMKSITPLKHLRRLQAEHEAHMVPSVTPMGLRITDTELRTFDHGFGVDPKTTGLMKETMDKMDFTCEDLLESAGKK